MISTLDLSQIDQVARVRTLALRVRFEESFQGIGFARSGSGDLELQTYFSYCACMSALFRFSPCPDVLLPPHTQLHAVDLEGRAVVPLRGLVLTAVVWLC